MGRPRQFDPEQTLDRALDLFWQRGYEATSIQDLVEATGVNRASLYATFGDKHRLFCAVLDRYEDRAGSALVEALERPGPAREVIAAALEAVVAAQAKAQGCLMANSAVERYGRCAETASRVDRSVERLRAAFSAVVARGQREGDISPRHAAPAWGNFLTSVVQGISVMGRAQRSQVDLAEAAALALSALS